MLTKEQAVLILSEIEKVLASEHGSGLVIIKLKNGKLNRLYPAPSIDIPPDQAPPPPQVGDPFPGSDKPWL